MAAALHFYYESLAAKSWIMVGDLPATGAANSLDESSRTFVGNVVRSGLVELARLKPVIASLLAQGGQVDPERISAGLVNAGMITNWQSKNLLAGKSRGFFLGSYRLLRPLGMGGMGVVYLAEHKVMQRRMALKILPRAAMADKTRVSRFEAEARAAAQLDHSNIVRAYDFSTAGGKSFIAMEYVEGVDLHRIVDRDGAMSPQAALDAISQAADGLAHAHERGIVHRDIKPSNLLMRHDGVLKVSDMGLARIGMQTDGSLTMENPSSMMGTADFLAPEQALDSHTVDGRADIYALGCTLYYLMTGKPPYPGGTLAQRIAKHQTAPPADIRRVRPDCPAAIAELAMHMMAKRPEDRVRSAQELVTQVRRIAASLGINVAAQGLSGSAAIRPQTSQPRPDYSHLSRDVPGSDPLNNLGMPSMGGGVSMSGSPSMAEGDDLFDFSDLPQVATTGPMSLSPSAYASGGKFVPGGADGQLQATSFGSPSNSGSTNVAKSGNLSGSHSVLLGIGLTIAVLALLATGSVVYWTLTRDPQDSRPAPKLMEAGKEKNVIILDNR
jgi:eukaryotic-like serine/threonine-protein kinase